MTFKEVVELGEQAKRVTFMDYVHLHSPFVFTLLVLITLLGLYLIFLPLFADISMEVYFLSLLFGSCLASFPMIFGFGLTGAASDIREAKIQAWKESIVKPYILSLPEKKLELLYVKLDPEVSVAGNRYNIYTETATAMVVSYLDESGKILTDTDWVDANMTRSEDEKAYITLHRLPEDLGNGVNAGDYYKVVHLPKGYQFTEIK